MRGLLDGHTWLSRKLATRGHYPAIDVLESISRLMIEVVDARHRAAAQTLRELMAVYRDHEDLISVGAYRAGSNPLVDRAIQMQGEINRFLRQRVDEPSSVSQARDGAIGAGRSCRAACQRIARSPLHGKRPSR